MGKTTLNTPLPSSWRLYSAIQGLSRKKRGVGAGYVEMVKLHILEKGS
jgi:hypothetical protein